MPYFGTYSNDISLETVVQTQTDTAQSIEDVWTWLFNDPSASLPIVIPLFIAACTVFWVLIKYSAKILAHLLVSLRNIYNKRTKILKITSPEHKNFSDFIDAYQRIFTEQERVSTTEIMEWSRGRFCGRDKGYNLHLIRSQSTFSGISITITSRLDNLIYIGFFGVDKEYSSYRETKEVCTKILKGISKELPSWKYCFFEMNDPHENEDSDRSRRDFARVKRFGQYAKTVGLELKFPEIRYYQPSHSNDIDLRSMEPMLLGIVCRDPTTSSLQKAEINSILSFLYNDVYKHCTPVNHPRYDLIEDEIKSIIKLSEDLLPDRITLNSVFSPSNAIDVLS